MILSPLREFSVVRQIANHLDTGTYFVRAEIRYAYTDELITRVPLILKGDQRYSANWRTPADVSGFGTWVSIITSVYTDAGFTTKSENYGDEANTYLVRDDLSPAMKGGGGGLDMRTTRRIIAEEIEKIKFPEQEKVVFPKQKEYDNKFNELSKGLEDIKALVGSLPAENNDLRPLMIRLNELAQEVKTKPVTPKTDLTPILEKLSDTDENGELSKEELKSILEDLKTSFTETMKKAIPEAMSKAEFTIPFKNLTMTPKEEKKVEKPFNIKNLAK